MSETENAVESAAAPVNTPSAAGPIHKPGRLPFADFVRATRGFVLPYGLDYREALKPEFWRGSMDRLTAGDRIEVHSSDRRIQFEIFVFESNELGPMVRFDIGFRALWPPDLELPDPYETTPSLYAMGPNGFSGWSVTAVGTGEVLGTCKSEHEARALVAALERRDIAAEREAELAEEHKVSRKTKRGRAAA